MKAKSINGSSPEEIESQLQNSMSDGFSPRVAIVFISIKQDRMAVAQIFTKKGIDVFGATSCGEFIDGNQSVGEIAILLLDLNAEQYQMAFEKVGDGSVEKTVKRISDKAFEAFKNPSLIVCSTGLDDKSNFFNGQKMVQVFEAALGADKIFFGGMAGDEWNLKKTYVFSNGKETDNGIVALIFDADQIELSGMAITGWKPMGITRTVTKSKGNLLYEIDGKSAVDMYLRYLAKEEMINDKEFNVFTELSFEYPFIVERDTNETVLKSPTKIIHEEYALEMDMEMPEGSKFWFTMPPDFDIVEEIVEKAAQIKDSRDANPVGILVFSCAGREPVLGPLATQENEGLAELWNVPMAGFFTYGEFGRVLNGKQNVHYGACCWVAISNKE